MKQWSDQSSWTAWFLNRAWPGLSLPRASADATNIDGIVTWYCKKIFVQVMESPCG